jgi:hypothetical protein
VDAKILLRGGADDTGGYDPNGGYPLGLWVRGQWKPSDTRAQWVSGYYVVVGGKMAGDKHFVRLTQIQVEGDCTTACGNPENLYNFNNTYLLAEATEIPGQLTRDEWHDLIVEVRGNNIKIRFDRNPAGELPDIDYTDDVIPFLTGTIGCKAYRDWTASWDDIVVTPLQ